METMGNSPTAIGWRVFQPSDAPTQYADLPSLHHSITPSLDPSPWPSASFGGRLHVLSDRWRKRGGNTEYVNVSVSVKRSMALVPGPGTEGASHARLELNHLR
jgi:hypothetical protein